MVPISTVGEYDVVGEGASTVVEHGEVAMTLVVTMTVLVIMDGY